MTVAEVVVCEVEEGTECRTVLEDCFGVDGFFPDAVDLFGDDGLLVLGDAGPLSDAELPWLVTKMVVKLSSLLPLRDPG